MVYHNLHDLLHLVALCGVRNQHVFQTDNPLCAGKNVTIAKNAQENNLLMCLIFFFYEQYVAVYTQSETNCRK